MKLPQSFYNRDTSKVAKDLIGKILVRRISTGVILKSVITETEAYLGLKDQACHTYGGRRTARTEIMWGHPGHAYIYFIYGMYFCLNAVTREAGVPEAVLIRGAIPVLRGNQVTRWKEHLNKTDIRHLTKSKSENKNRFHGNQSQNGNSRLNPSFDLNWKKIMSGPGKLCKVLEIDKTLNGLSLASSDLWIEEGLDVKPKDIVKGPRVGIDYTLNDPAGSHQWPLRFIWKFEKQLDQEKGGKNESLFRHHKNNRQNSSHKNAAARKKSSSRNISKA